jgi:hypothetical protein
MWDVGQVTPMLAKLLTSGELEVAGKRVLVPGSPLDWVAFPGVVWP